MPTSGFFPSLKEIVEPLCQKKKEKRKKKKEKRKKKRKKGEKNYLFFAWFSKTVIDNETKNKGTQR